MVRHAKSNGQPSFSDTGNPIRRHARDHTIEISRDVESVNWCGQRKAKNNALTVRLGRVRVSTFLRSVVDMPPPTTGTSKLHQGFIPVVISKWRAPHGHDTRPCARS